MHLPSLLLSAICALAAAAPQQSGGKPIACNTVQPVYECYYSQCSYPQACYDQCYQALVTCYNGTSTQSCYNDYNLCQNKCTADSPCRQCCNQAGISKCHTKDAATCCAAAYGQ
ncbi:hypothetical protein PENSUB_2580 [Penicillium subrubescens]|uniref:Uncharacterized protein n=1 Tax=Penicillium subrubescens TaxID=1316194 RepID=A0A1Q5UHF1_9EURO|nr:hypothetical protein PENSUB_2580 [Penicillium subrubescens]